MPECWGCHVKPSERERCEAISMRWDRHHVLPKQIIRREFPNGAFMFDGEWVRMLPALVEPEAIKIYRHRRLEELLADERNLVDVRRYHHDCIERRMLIVHFEDVPAPAVEFATELGLLHHLERLYPPAVPQLGADPMRFRGDEYP